MAACSSISEPASTVSSRLQTSARSTSIGNVLEGNGKPPLEFHLHAGIYKARPDVQAIVHAHPKWSTFLTMVGESYESVYAQGTLVYPMPVLDSPRSINNPDMAKRLADTLGDRPAAMMKSHGAVTCGETS